MPSGETSDAELRRLRQRLLRTETNLRRLEDQREATSVLHASIIRKLEASGLALERKNAELVAIQEQLALSERVATQASRAKSTFLANMSHELRTPLNAILGYSELLHEEAAEVVAGLGTNEIARIREAGRHLLGLIDQVLDLSKVEAGRMEIDAGEVNVEHLIRALVSTVAPLAERKGLSLNVCFSRVGTLYTDRQKVAQILLNLLSNAIKFTERGGVTVEVGCDAHELNVCVRDTGIGMTLEQQKRVFLPFEQADPSTTRRFGGTGLGLAISERFCTLLGGTLTVESEPGRGTVFQMTLPVGAAPTSAAGDSLWCASSVP